MNLLCKIGSMLSMSKNSFPNFLIVGAAKSGTTTLHQILKEHPEIYMPERKELNFWYTHGKDNWPILKRFPDLPKNLDEYLSYFKTDKKIIGEASPGYLVYYNEVINNLKKLHPNPNDIKIIIILREPVDKIWSHYKMVHRGKMDPDNLSLLDSLKREHYRKQNSKYLLDVLPVYSTDYLNQVKAYLKNFKSVKVILFDDLEKSTQTVFNEITDFLGVANCAKKNIDLKYNAAPKKKTSRNRFLERIAKTGVNKLVPEKLKEFRRGFSDNSLKMDRKSKKRLVNKFKNDIKELEQIINKDLSNWLKKYN